MNQLIKRLTQFNTLQGLYLVSGKLTKEDLFNWFVELSVAIGYSETSVREQSNPNILYLDSEGPYKVSDLGPLFSFLDYKAFHPGTRIAAIQSPHHLTATCTNKLLKILEEIPDKTVIVLLHHDQTKLMQTLTSRAVKFNLPPKDSLKSMVNLEGSDLLKKLLERNEDNFSDEGQKAIIGWSIGHIELHEIIDTLKKESDVIAKTLKLCAKFHALRADSSHKLPFILEDMNKITQSLPYHPSTGPILARLLEHLSVVR